MAPHSSTLAWKIPWTKEPSHFHALEKEMATHSSVLAWRIPGTGEPGGLIFSIVVWPKDGSRGENL